MLPRFHALPPVEFGALIERFTFARHITSLHLHHTATVPPDAWSPGTDPGAALPAHDLPVHVLVAPDGTIWTGRHWDRPPRSAAGHNGTAAAGPFAIALAGDFDRDRPGGAQRAAAEEVIARVRRRFRLPPDAIVAHRALEPATSCPGYGVDVRALARRASGRPRAGRRPAPPFPDHTRVFHAALLDLERTRPRAGHHAPLDADAGCGASPGTAPAPVEAATQPFPPPRTTEVPAARRVALCVGVDAYPDAPLAGCVADAKRWADTLAGLGFTPHLLLDEEATRAAILDRLEALVTSAVEGDVVVFMFAGHGTQVPDGSGDERDRKDEALCPVDYGDGRLLVDDDLAPVMDRVPAGVNLTCFIDCCHSGTSTRLAIGSGTGGERVRSVVLPPGVLAAHRRFRAGRPAPPRRRARREVLFAACRPDELAWESKGQGDFTRKATARLPDAALTVTHEEFNDQVTAAFGPAPRQHPMLTCAASARRRRLLAPVASGEPAVS